MLNRIVNLVSQFRFHIATLIVIGVVATGLVLGGNPIVTHLIAQTKIQISSWTAIQNSAQLPNQRDSLVAQIGKMETVLLEGQSREGFNEAELLQQIYTNASTIGFSVSKVELGDPQGTSGSRQFPVVLAGTGSYNAVGAMIAQIENLNRFTRITYCTIKKEERYDRLSCFLEFVVLEVQ